MNFLSEAVKKVGAVGASNPTLFFAAGVTGMVASTVLACRATLKLEQTLEPFEVPPDYPIEEGGLMRNRVRCALAVTKLYAPAFIVGAASVTMLTKSHSTLVKRNAALTAAYTALDKGFRDYRARVVDKYGTDVDDQMRYGSEVESEKIGSKTVKKVKAGKDAASIYAVWFDQTNPNWSRDPEVNKIFLRAQQNYFNDVLHARGHLFLNEVYKALGFDHSQAGAVVGWVLSDDGDNYVDLGVFGDDSERIRDFVNGREAAVLLDFNVDGLIWDRIKKHPTHDLRWQDPQSRWFNVKS